MPESNQVKWIGIRPTNPEENIPVKQSDPALLKATVNVAAAQEIIAKQSDPALLKATVNVAAAQEIIAKQSDPALLKATVTQASNIREVYPKRKTGTTQITLYAGAANSVSIIHTVTAGKTFFLTFAHLGIYAPAPGYVEIQVRDQDDVLRYGILMTCVTASSSSPTHGTFIPPIEIAAGWDIVVSSIGAGLGVVGFVSGWEE